MTDPASNSWQAIDTAPADQEILVFTKNWGPIIALHSTEYGEWMSRMQVPVGIKGEDELPTHWQHLPAPPAEAGTEGGNGADAKGPDAQVAAA
jgi:hypothetical protein